MKKELSFSENGWIKTNIKYAIIGIATGVVINIFIGTFTSTEVNLKDVLVKILFSLLITLSIANIIAFLQRYFNSFNINFWKFILIFYSCNFIGMFIGIEVSYLIVSLIFNVKYEFLKHIDDYRATPFITFIIGTVILLFHFQKVNAQALIKAKEVDLFKINQLKTEAELQTLQSKINPHFLYNALNSIVSLIHENPDKAEDMTMKLSKFFRYSINTMEENYCSIKEELEILNTYLGIEKVRFGDRINFKITVDDELLEKQIPRFLLQPLVENALKHGLKNSVADGELSVNILKNDSKIDLYISDNGIPFPEELNAGYGLKSTFDKLQLLYNTAYDLQLNNNPNKHIKISIPILN